MFAHHDGTSEEIVSTKENPEVQSNLADHINSNTDQSPELPAEIQPIVHHDDNETILQIEQDVENPMSNAIIPADTDIHSINSQTTPIPCVLGPLRYVVYLMQIAPASTEAADIVMSLYQSHTKSLPILITAPLFAFFTNVGLTGEPIKENCDEVCTLVTKRTLPSDRTEWPVISSVKEKIAAAVAIFITPFNSGGEGLQSFFFVRSVADDYFPNAGSYVLAGWDGLSGLVAFCVAGSKILTESTEAYKLTRRFLANERRPYANRFSQIVSPIVGGFYGGLKTGQEAIQTYIAMKWIFSVTDVVGMSTIGILSTINMFPNFSFAGVYNINFLDAFIGRVWNRDFGFKEVLAFALAGGGAAYLAYWQRPLNYLFYEDVRSDIGSLDDYLTDSVLTGLSWLMFSQGLLQGTGSLIGPMYKVINCLCNKIDCLKNRILNYFFSDEDNRTDEERHLLNEESESEYEDSDNEFEPGIQDEEGAQEEDEENNAFHEVIDNDIEAMQSSFDHDGESDTCVQEAAQECDPEPLSTATLRDQENKPYSENNSNLIFNNYKNLQKKHQEPEEKSSICLVM